MLFLFDMQKEMQLFFYGLRKRQILYVLEVTDKGKKSRELNRRKYLYSPNLISTNFVNQISFKEFHVMTFVNFRNQQKTELCKGDGRRQGNQAMVRN